MSKIFDIESYRNIDFDIYEKLKSWKNASEIYYDETDNESPLSDEEFDSLTRDLISSGYTDIVEFVTKKIQTNDGLVSPEMVKTEMVSLFKIDWIKNKPNLSIRDLVRFLNTDNIQIFNAYIALKFDGHALKTIWKNGELFQAQTRGGQDVTKHLEFSKPIMEVKKKLLEYGYSLENNIYHCELLLSKIIYNKNWSTKYKNPRNAVSGVLKLEPNDLYIVPLTDGINPLLRMPHWFRLSDFIERFNTSNQPLELHNLSEIYAPFKLDTYPFRVDGFVVGFETEKQVIKDNYPLNLVSIKFEAMTAVTKIIGVEWSQKKTGKLTPIYLLEPVSLDGTTVSRASGYNLISMKEMGTGLGAIVEIEKSNDIIPKVIRTIQKSREFILPDVEFKTIGREIYATDNTVSIEQKFILGLRTLNIDGIGDKTAEEIGKVLNFDIISLFDVNNKFKLLETLGNSVAYKKICDVYNTKTMYLDALILLLQFNGVGIKLSNTFGLFFTKQINKLDNVDRNVIDFMLKGEGKTMLEKSMKRLQSMGIKIIKPIEINDTTLTFEMSGTPKTFNTKEEFMSKFKTKFPNAIKTSLTKNTKLLIVDDVNSSTGKANKARKYNVEIISYEDAVNTYIPNFKTEDNEQ